jgi:HemY protein
MLWSLIKFILFIALVAGLSLGAMYLMETGAGVRIAIANMEFTLGPIQAVIGAVILLLLVWLLLRLAGLLVAVLRFLNGDETRSPAGSTATASARATRRWPTG